MNWKRGRDAPRSGREANKAPGKRKGGLGRPSSRARRLSCHRLQSQREPALVASRLVLVDDVLVGDAVDDAARLAERFTRSGLVAGLDGLADALDRGA